MTRQDFRRPEVTNRILRLKAQGKSFSQIMAALNKEFALGLKSRSELTNYYYAELKDIRKVGAMKVVKGELSELDKKRMAKAQIVMNQMDKVNSILWDYYRELEKSKKILKKALNKWKKKLDTLAEPDIEIIREVRATISSNIANISSISSNILKQLELQTKTLGMLSKPTTVNISNLELNLQINQVLKKIESQGYFMIRSTDEKLIKKLVREGKLERY